LDNRYFVIQLISDEKIRRDDTVVLAAPPISSLTTMQIKCKLLAPPLLWPQIIYAATSWSVAQGI